MASKVIKESFKNVITRNYAAQAATTTKQHSYTLPHHQPIVSKLENGAVVAAYENNSPVSRIAIFARSGSRYETPENWGVSQMLRLCAGQKTEKFSAFGLTRELQQRGWTLACESGREHISYEITYLREDLTEAFHMISNVAARPVFHHWEISNQNVRLLTELGSRSPTVLVLDLLHKAAFRNTGLGNSLFVPEFHVGKITPDQLHQFVKDTHTGSRLAFVGLGVPHLSLMKLARKFTVGTEPGLASPSIYGGGEIREEIGGSLAYVALAGPGAKIGTDEAMSLAVAQFVLGGTPGTKYGANASSKLASIIAAAGGSGTATPINASYSDGGLFGFVLVEEAQKVGDVVKALAKGIRTLKVTDADVKNAKARAKAALLMATESEENELDEIGMQALFTGGYIPPSELAASIDKVTSASVQSALTNAAKGKPALASYGAVHNVPYVDQL